MRLSGSPICQKSVNRIGYVDDEAIEFVFEHDEDVKDLYLNITPVRDEDLSKQSSRAIYNALLAKS